MRNGIKRLRDTIVITVDEDTLQHSTRLSLKVMVVENGC